MPSDEQLIANLANSGFSTGPKTEAGKHRTRLNAYRHGLTGQIRLLTEAENQAFELHCAGIREALAPVGALELDLAQSIAENRWRLKLARALETGIFAAGHLGELGQLAKSGRTDPAQLPIDEAISRGRTWLSEAKSFALLTLYEQRIQRSIERNMIELRTLRAERQAIRQQALEEAQLLAQHTYSKGETYDPAADFPPEIVNLGFEFSTIGIARLVARNQRLNEARRPVEIPKKADLRTQAAA